LACSKLRIDQAANSVVVTESSVRYDGDQPSSSGR
jgi:hypothetical protein